MKKNYKLIRLLFENMLCHLAELFSKKGDTRLYNDDIIKKSGAKNYHEQLNGGTLYSLHYNKFLIIFIIFRCKMELEFEQKREEQSIILALCLFISSK